MLRYKLQLAYSIYHVIIVYSAGAHSGKGKISPRVTHRRKTQLSL